MPTSQDAFQAILTGTPLINTKVPRALPEGVMVAPWAEPTGRLRVYPSRRNRLGVYHVNMGNSTVTLAADGALVGRFWLVNTSPTVVVAVRQVFFTSVSSTALVTLTAPNFNVERVTFTGTPTGAQVLPANRDSRDAAPTATLRTASTGMTLTAGNVAHAFQTHSVLTGIGVSTVTDQVWPAHTDEDAYLVLRQNEGLVIRQATAGTLADTRSVRLDAIWEEFVE